MRGSLACASGLCESGVLVIGYGNELRGDDAVGRRAAEAVAGWNLPGVEVLSLHQLTPELAERLASARLAIFIDASIEGEQVAVHQLQPAAEPRTLGHTGDPAELVMLAKTLYGQCPRTLLMTIPAVNTELAEGLSSIGERALQLALEWLQELLSARLTARCGVIMPQHARE